MKRWLSGPSHRGWALLLLVLALAAILRLWGLDAAPPGLYRDEASNGLDALGVLQGQHAVYFTANNGREPAYIYLTALAIALLGRTVVAVRLAAAFAGALTTIPVYLLARSWFGQRVALIAAWLWAVTLWPLHLSRIGLRAVLLPPLLALVFWLGTRAYRRQHALLWLSAGIVYGLAFYTYLAVRFTPLLLLLLLSYLLLKHPQSRARLWPFALWFVLGTIITILPLAVAAYQQPALVLGRAGQVSIFNPTIGGQNPLLVLLRQAGRALGMFLWRGDDIVRHNPAGRPVFDLLLAVPLLVGLLYCLHHWRRKAPAALILWILVMLGPTVLAEDAPHFLRAVGVLPAVLFLPALGLSKLWEWPKLAGALRRGLVLFLACGTLIVTIADYVDYVRQPDTAYLFESAARELAQRVSAEPGGIAVYVDRRYQEGWPSVAFLLPPSAGVTWFAPQDGLPAPLAAPVTIYAWPFQELDFIPRALRPPVLVSVQEGALARGDLEPQPYPLYLRYAARVYQIPAPQAIFDARFALQDTSVTTLSAQRLQVDLYWSIRDESLTSPPPTVFVHIVDSQSAAADLPLAQSDAPLARGFWPLDPWQSGQVVQEQHVVIVPEPFDHTRHRIVVGLYDAVTTVRLPAWTPQGEPLGDSWLLSLEPPHEEN